MSVRCRTLGLHPIARRPGRRTRRLRQLEHRAACGCAVSANTASAASFASTPADRQAIRMCSACRRMTHSHASRTACFGCRETGRTTPCALRVPASISTCISARAFPPRAAAAWRASSEHRRRENTERVPSRWQSKYAVARHGPRAMPVGRPGSRRAPRSIRRPE